MTSYNAWNKVPMTSHPIIRDITMKEWGWTASSAQMPGLRLPGDQAQVLSHEARGDHSHHQGGSQPVPPRQRRQGRQGRDRGQVLAEADLDAVLRGSFRTALRLGLLDPPSTVSYTRLKGAPNPVDSEEHNAVARQVSLESMVLLKNANKLLPLDRQALKSIAVIGPLATRC